MRRLPTLSKESRISNGQSRYTERRKSAEIPGRETKRREQPKRPSPPEISNPVTRIDRLHGYAKLIPFAVAFAVRIVPNPAVRFAEGFRADGGSRWIALLLFRCKSSASFLNRRCRTFQARKGCGLRGQMMRSGEPATRKRGVSCRW